MNSQSAPSEGNAPKRQRKPEIAAFGRMLKRLREKRFPKWAPEQVAAHLESEGLARTTGSSIRGYEFGWNRSIDPVVLAGLARIYQVPLLDLIAVLAANRADPEMADFDVARVLERNRGANESETAAAARFAEVGQRLQTISAELALFAADASELTGGRRDGSGKPPTEGGK